MHINLIQPQQEKAVDEFGGKLDKAEKLFKEQKHISAHSELLRLVDVELLNYSMIHPATLVCKYLLFEQYGKAMDWIERGYQIPDPGVPWYGYRIL